METTADHDGHEKEWKTHNARTSRPIAMLLTIYRLYSKIMLVKVSQLLNFVALWKLKKNVTKHVVLRTAPKKHRQGEHK